MAKRMLLKAGTLGLVVMSLYATIGFCPAEVKSFTIDTSLPTDIEAPFEIAEIGIRGERGLYVPPTAGQGWRGTGSGSVIYRFNVPIAGEYHVWAYCHWLDACSNAIYARFDGDDRAIIGNDPVYMQWHWVRAFSVYLSEGDHQLELTNHSHTVAVQSLFLVNSFTVQPETHAAIFDDLFYEGFDGCSAGLLERWVIHSGKWMIREATPARPGGGELVVRPTSEAYMMHKVKAGASCVISVSSELPADATSTSAGGVCFTVAETKERFLMAWRRTSRSDKLIVSLSNLSKADKKVLESFSMQAASSDWHSILLKIHENYIGVVVDGGRERPVSVKVGPISEIGLWASGNEEVFFDNIQVKRLLLPETDD